MSGERRFGASPLDVGHLYGFAQARASCWRVGRGRRRSCERERRSTSVGVIVVRGQSCGVYRGENGVGFPLQLGSSRRNLVKREGERAERERGRACVPASSRELVSLWRLREDDEGAGLGWLLGRPGGLRGGGPRGRGEGMMG